MPPSRLIVLTSVALLGGGRAVTAQGVRPEIGLGAAVPTGALGARRGAGPLARAGLLLGDSARIVRARVDGEAAWMPGRDEPLDISTASGTFRALSAVVTLLAGPAGRAVAPYALLGAAAQWVEVRGRPNPYGTLVGLRVGAGLRGTLGRYRVRLEVAPHVVLSDYGTGRDFTAGTYWPVSLGMTF